MASQGDDAAAIDAPWHFVLVLAGGHAGVAFNAAVGITKEFHASHDFLPSRRPDLAERCLGFLHARCRVVAIGRERVDALAKHDRICALRILAA